MSADAVTIRSAVAGELDALMAIDDDAGAVFVHAGLDVDMPPGHEFSMTERERLRRCLVTDSVVIAMNGRREAIGFAALGSRDGLPFLQQISVRFAQMRRGIGSRLLESAIRMARRRGANALWLTTYAHLPWNRPFYERHGFEVVEAAGYGEALARELEYERRWLPRPGMRIVMRRNLESSGRIGSRRS